MRRVLRLRGTLLGAFGPILARRLSGGVGLGLQIGVILDDLFRDRGDGRPIADGEPTQLFERGLREVNSIRNGLMSRKGIA